ncbi:hypothetical protein DUI87_01732 [Hirundo rustica rustica]|uniref:ribonuclease H n=1 Tax=Hirundo rustica rustica TaxID=333673 RepID=A0A3M0L5W2_HIRRU|nr:hypothetical protein DUI87_01732 [Hirundo rustica rustica]
MRLRRRKKSRLSLGRVEVTSLLENVQGLLNVKGTTFLVFHLVTFLYIVYSFSRMSRTLLNTVGQHIEAREQGDKSFTQAAANPTATQVAAKPDSEAKTPAIAAVKKRNKHIDKTDQPVDDDSGEGSSMPPDTQSGVKPTDTQSEAEATDDTQSEAKPTNTKSEAQSTSTRSKVQPTSTQSKAQPTSPRSGVQPTSTRTEAQPTATISGARPTSTRSRDTIESFYLKDLRSLRKDYTRRPDKSIISYLVCLWDAAENPSAISLLKVEEQQVPIATSTVHHQQYRTTQDAVIPIHKILHKLETQGVVSKTHSHFNSPIWPVRKSDREWKLTVDYRALNKVTPPLSAAVPDMLELQYELESKAAKREACSTLGNRLPQGWKHSPTICHELIQAALEKSEAPKHLQYINDIIVWGNTAIKVFEKRKKIIQILLKASFAIKKSKVKRPAREIQFLRVK